ncbi:NADPH-dependent oxidoreductase [Actinomadura spongiicola]|uniref:NADPH-dependent oxidoreductase n=1 Tax=Actinomadura spongiicola TaxID=2303421 RepID=A0A372GQN7_9ACTN|nr:NAD(P)H-dependent oxidoreductase [Actinomadura spongiicola]RFS87403.1 NADPH-dependent oxidoreductase [Actinomadura spongiicola]
MSTRIVTLVGNPRPNSRTRAVAIQAADTVGRRLGAVDHETLDLSALAVELGSPSPSAVVEVAVETVRGADVLVVATPTYKGTYTGLLKLFLDRLPGGALAATVALPLMVMGDARHALAVEVHLRPLLVELGAFVPTPGVVLLDDRIEQAGEVLRGWVDRIAPQFVPLLTGRTVVA